MNTLKVKLLRNGAGLPMYSNANSPGFDLFACIDGRQAVSIPPASEMIVGIGLELEPCRQMAAIGVSFAPNSPSFSPDGEMSVKQRAATAPRVVPVLPAAVQDNRLEGALS